MVPFAIWMLIFVFRFVFCSSDAAPGRVCTTKTELRIRIRCSYTEQWAMSNAWNGISKHLSTDGILFDISHCWKVAGMAERPRAGESCMRPQSHWNDCWMALLNLKRASPPSNTSFREEEKRRAKWYYRLTYTRWLRRRRKMISI